jgi:hypothetical protein
MTKKLWIGFIVVYIVWNMLNMIIHGMILGSTYATAELMKIWRPDMQNKMWIFYLVAVFTSFFYTLIFSKWYKGKGLVEGIQYGVYTGFLMAIPMAYSSYAMYPIPYSLALQWFIYGMIHYIILGIILALIFGRKPIEGTTA